jgi:hypothetical protein
MDALLISLLFLLQIHTWSLWGPEPPKAPDPPPPVVEVKTLPRLEVVSASWCVPCRDWWANQAPRITGVETVKIDYDTLTPEQREERGATRIPHFTLKDADGTVRGRWTGYLTQQLIDAKLSPPRVSQPRPQNRYIRQSTIRWSVNGVTNPTREGVIRHLMQAHRHQLSRVPPEQLQRLSLGELRAIHDDAHNGRQIRLLSTGPS